jgi:RHS repeat-associated protein
MNRRIVLLASCLSFVLTGPSRAGSVLEIVPASAPAGASLIINGTSLDAPDVAVSFASSGGGTVVASIDGRNATRLDLRVPGGAVTGPVRVYNGGGTLGTFSFTVSESPAVTSVGTIAISQTGGVLKTPQANAVLLATGTTYIANTGGHDISQVTAAGEMSVLAGRGDPGSANGTGLAAQFKQPEGIGIDQVRQLIYVADTANHRIRKITTAGVVTYFAGSGKRGNANGTGTAATFSSPSGLAVDGQGNVYVADSGNHSIRKITPAGVVTTFAGRGRAGRADGSTSQAEFNEPRAVAATDDGTIYVADTANHTIRRIANSVVSTIGGNASVGFLDGPAAATLFFSPMGITVESPDVLLIGDAGNHRIRRLNHRTQTVSTVAGAGAAGYSDGAPGSALFRNPSGVSAFGRTFVSDTNNNALRAVYQQVRLTAVYPRAGNLQSAEIRIFGTGFVPGATQVTVDGTPLGAVIFENSTLLRATIPHRLTPGTVAISVTTGGGAATLNPGYVYLGPPSISSILPGKGPLAGGIGVTVRGAQFAPDGTRVFFGAQEVTSVTIVDSTNLTITAPPGATGPVDVRVSTAAGSATRPGGFVYMPPPQISSFTPASGLPGTTVTIQGAGFDPEPDYNAVKFNGIYADRVTSATTSEISAVVSAGASTGRISVTTGGGTVQSTTDFSVLAVTAIEVIPTSAGLSLGQSLQAQAVATLSDGTSRDVTATAIWATTRQQVATVTQGLITGIGSGRAVISASVGGKAGTCTVEVIESPPADPATTAPASDPTRPTNFVESIAFLHTGPNATQRGVLTGALNERRIAVIRGRVVDAAGVPISSAKISVHHDPNVGYTLSRADGAYDVVVNGGADVTLVLAKDGFIPVHRRVRTIWNDFATADDTVLLLYDPRVTTLELSSLSVVTPARGTVISDQSGARQATLLFQPGTSASMRLPNGSSQPLTTINVRATEQSVGVGAMPAPLPQETAYTYCVELSADEAVVAGATSVEFTKPVFIYLENFLAFPVGTKVPAGYYDRTEAEWIAADNGQVVKILGVTGGVASLDTDGDGAADEGTALGVSTAERQALGGLYAAGQTLWRVPVTHFTPWDLNWPFALPAGAVAPAMPVPATDDPLEDPACQSGSIIECENRVLGKSIPVAGTPFTLEYRSRFAEGYKHRTRVDIGLSGETVPAPLKRIELVLEIAGNRTAQTFPPAPNQSRTFEWNARDAYGRAQYLDKPMLVKIGYVYDVNFQTPPILGRAFFGTSSGPPIGGIRAEQTLWQEYRVPLRGSRPDQGLGGWLLAPIHAYDSGGSVVRMGTGQDVRMEARGLDPQPTGVSGYNARFLRSGPDGSIYAFSAAALQPAVYRVAPGGATTLVAGGGTAVPQEGGLAAGARIRPKDVSVAPNGDLYFIDEILQKVFRVRNGRLATVFVGTNPISAAYSGGGLYVIDDGEVWRVDAGRTAIRIAARDDYTHYGQLLTSPNGKLYALAHRSLTPLENYDHVYSPWPVNWESPIYRFGAHAGSAHGAFTFDDAGNLLIAKRLPPLGKNAVSIVRPNGAEHKFTPAKDLAQGTGLTITPDGTVAFESYSPMYCPSNGGLFNCIFIAGRPGPDGSVSQGFIAASASGRESLKFSGTGKHLETRNAATGGLLHLISYDRGSGLPINVIDSQGRSTQIVRDAGGTATAIIAPNGERTELRIEGGLLLEISGPGAQRHEFAYTPDGLLEAYTNPRRIQTTYTYDTIGRLRSARDARGGEKTLSESQNGSATTVTLATSLNRQFEYMLRRMDASTSERSFKGPDGLTTSLSSNALQQTTMLPDGTQVIVDKDADPQWEAMVPRAAALRILLPSGTQLAATATRTATFSSLNDPTSLTSRTETVSVNGRAYTATFTRSDGRLRVVTPAGREITTFLRPDGQLSAYQITGLGAVSFGYDGIGRMTGASDGTRGLTFGYNALDQLISITDTASRTVRFEYDPAGRVSKQILPDTREIAFGYDANGNLTSLTPPGRPPHFFTYMEVDGLDNYSPPAAADSGATSYAYNLDRQLALVTLPGGAAVNLTYDGAGRIGTLGWPGRNLTFGYDASTGDLRTVTGADTALGYTFDGPLLKSVSWSGSVTGTVSWEYDDSFRVMNESVGGQAVAFGYDSDSLLTSAGSMTVTRHPQHGLVTATALGNTMSSLSNTPQGEPDGFSLSVSGSAAFAYSLARDAAGRVRTKSETVFGTTSVTEYGYDPAGRLTSVTVNGNPSSGYTYDANGNRLTRTDSSGTTTATYDDQDRLLTSGDITFSYSAQGYLSTRTSLGQTTTFNYDALGNLQSVSMPGRMVEYLIDGQNRRVGKKVDGVFQRAWLYGDQLRVVGELDATGAVVSRFVYATRPNSPDYMVRGSVVYRFVTDHLGSPRLVINTADGTVAQRMDYDEFGRVTSDTNPGFQPFGFAGGLQDQDTGLVRFGARDYDPHSGRFVSKDPIGFSGGDANLYAYVLNDPINLIDPMGTDWVEAMEPVGDFFAGMGDTLSFGLTTRFNEWTGGSAIVDECSGAFSAGEWTGRGVSVAFGASHLGRNALKQGVARLAYDNRAWGTVRTAWSGRPGTLHNTGRSLHHWLIPQRAGAPRGIANAGLNYMPISAGLNSYMNGSTATRLGVEWGFRGTVAGIYGGPFESGGGSDGCGCR